MHVNLMERFKSTFACGTLNFMHVAYVKELNGNKGGENGVDNELLQLVQKTTLLLPSYVRQQNQTPSLHFIFLYKFK